jgi:hypothetical protein
MDADADATRTHRHRRAGELDAGEASAHAHAACAAEGSERLGRDDHEGTPARAGLERAFEHHHPPNRTRRRPATHEREPAGRHVAQRSACGTRAKSLWLVGVGGGPDPSADLLGQLDDDPLWAAHRALTRPRDRCGRSGMSPVTTLPLAILVGVAGAVAVVILQTLVADVVGGAVAIAALIGVTWSTIRLAGDVGAPDDESA